MAVRSPLRRFLSTLLLVFLASSILVPRSVARKQVCFSTATPHVSPTPGETISCARLLGPARKVGVYIRWRFGVSKNSADRILVDVRHYARRFHVSPMIVLAVIATESHFKPQAESDVGAEGLMQVYSGTRTYQIEQNIRDGVSILRQKLAFSGGSYPRALAMYCGYFSAHCPGGARYVHTVYHWYYLFKWAAAHGTAHLPRVVSV